MGLDMYLSKRHYVQNWNHTKPSELHHITIAKGGKPSIIRPDRISFIEERVGYWYKANQIHRWFVNHCQDGIDDCRNAYVSFEQLQELLATITEILDEPNLKRRTTLAEEKLPIQDGPFFGRINYDEGYWRALHGTKDMLTALLAEPEAELTEYQYHSSW